MEDYGSQLQYTEMGDKLIVYDKIDKVVRMFNHRGIMIRRRPNISTEKEFLFCIEYFQMVFFLKKFELN
jgi:hypothetical protein